MSRAKDRDRTHNCRKISSTNRSFTGTFRTRRIISVAKRGFWKQLANAGLTCPSSLPNTKDASKPFVSTRAFFSLTISNPPASRGKLIYRHSTNDPRLQIPASNFPSNFLKRKLFCVQYVQGVIYHLQTLDLGMSVNHADDILFVQNHMRRSARYWTCWWMPSDKFVLFSTLGKQRF